MQRRKLLTAPAALAALSAPRLGLAQGTGSWPDRPVRIVVPYPPGGSNDTVARILQPKLTELLGRPVVVENRAGASGSVGSSETARSAPDGYTWLLANDTLATNETLMNLPYRVMQAFSFCTMVGTCPYALVTHPSTPFRNFQQMVEAAKARPQTLNYATTGVGSGAHIATVLLQQRGDFKLEHVPYRGGGPALQDALAGHVPLFMSNIVIILPHIRAGALRPLGLTQQTDSRYLPGVVPFTRQGFPGFEALTYWQLVGPAGIPQPILDRMQRAVKQVLAEPNVQARMAEQGADIVGSTPAETAAFVRSEIEKWGAVIRDNNIRADS
ncbi:tripartite tricarboxylate transporter substrate binding protein [Falsiroseomonas selenitidurans]|uniref:Tripartite tricarboxylate transporter substrate binding protein n=1 Tax=Falsiroseomonas selenitidurans TaxID=2716335 RepID=A0ABX1E5I3_9PROT|nr:tripartite tricarboxylate transporter substrate binding protein [Falsiroseomonas selenitidurans]NKC32439.1 tripartite tricarboxylate transporter substrate binding protein [Falsiroseomonas selenitidurans]